uniref:Putative secreted protein n=1 Tax=Anopheles marajoara TaxID=58244 RepID=A0A2M4CDY8_9DIPT
MCFLFYFAFICVCLCVHLQQHFSSSSFPFLCVCYHHHRLPQPCTNAFRFATGLSFTFHTLLSQPLLMLSYL